MVIILLEKNENIRASAQVHIQACAVKDIDEDDITQYPIEFLNDINLSGFPPHILTIKIALSFSCKIWTKIVDIAMGRGI